MAHKLAARFDKGLNFGTHKGPGKTSVPPRGDADAGQPRGSAMAAARITDAANRLVVRATRADPREVDWNAFAMIIDFIKYMSGGPGITQVLKAFKRRWRSGNPLIQAKVLGGVDFCINYIGRAFSARLAGAELWREIKDATKYKNLVKPSVYEMLMVYIQAWAKCRGSVTALGDFHAKLLKRDYKFPPPDSYDMLRPPRYIPLKQRTDDAVKVEMLGKAEAAIQEDDALSVADLAEDAVIQEGEDDGIVVTARVPSADLINLLDLDWDDDSATQGQAGVDPFAQSSAPAAQGAAIDAGPVTPGAAAAAAPAAAAAGGGAAAASGNPFGEPDAVFAAPVAGAIPAATVPAPGEQKNPFGNPFTGGVGVQPQAGNASVAASCNPFGDDAPPPTPVQPPPAPSTGNAWAVFGAAPPAAAQAWGPGPGQFVLPADASFSVARNQQLLLAQQAAIMGGGASFSMPAGAVVASFSAPSGPGGATGFPMAAVPVLVHPSAGSFVQPQAAPAAAPGAAPGPAHGQAGVSHVLAGIPHPAQQKDPLARLLE